jgi:hypothetical protein
MKTFTALSFGMGSGPRVEIFTEIICRGYYHDRLAPDALLSSPSGNTTTASIFHNSPLSLVQVCFTQSDCSWH